MEAQHPLPWTSGERPLSTQLVFDFFDDTVPTFERTGAVLSTTSGRVPVTTTGPGADQTPGRTNPAVLPVLGGATTRRLSSTDAHTPSR